MLRAGIDALRLRMRRHRSDLPQQRPRHVLPGRDLAGVQHRPVLQTGRIVCTAAAALEHNNDHDDNRRIQLHG